MKDTWGFRGANVNMKDANGNYYIDPNRQLKGTDIQEMRELKYLQGLIPLVMTR